MQPLDHILEVVKERGHKITFLICTYCQQKFIDDDYDIEKKDRPTEYLLKFIPRHCEDIVSARKVLRHLQEKGWTNKFR